MNIYLAIILYSTTAFCQLANDGQSAVLLQYDIKIPALPKDIDVNLSKEFTRVEQLIKPPGDIETIGANVIIGLTNRFNSSENSNPWVVAINNNGDHFCTGSILNKEWIITAAHCFQSPDPSNFSILTGTNFKSDGNEYKITKIILHPRYDVSTHKSADVALLKIDGKIDLSDSIKPIGLPTLPFEEPVPGVQVMSTGWGKETIVANGTEHYLGEIWLTIIKPELCASAYKKLGPRGHPVFRSQICTWNLNQNVCQGNSGGPAVVYKEDKPILTGTVSYGVKCIDKYPVVFSKVSYFLSWINQTMWFHRG